MPYSNLETDLIRLFEAEKWGRLESQCRQVISNEPGKPLVLFLLGFSIFVRAKKSAEAFQVLKEVVERADLEPRFIDLARYALSIMLVNPPRGVGRDLNLAELIAAQITNFDHLFYNAEVNEGYADTFLDTGHYAKDTSSVPYASDQDVLNVIAEDNLRYLGPIGESIGLGLTAIQDLRQKVQVKPQALSPFYKAAYDLVDEFSTQYPMNCYAILAKCFVGAFAVKALKHVKPRGPIGEIAIGEGSLSQRVFEMLAKQLARDAYQPNVVGFDLTPYSLHHASKMSHVSRAVVADCKALPIADKSFHVLIANNFMHHIQNKRETLTHYAQKAGHIIFNENTPFWSSYQAEPYELMQQGYVNLSRVKTHEFSLNSYQHLNSVDELNAIVDQSSLSVVDKVSYFDRSLFYMARSLLSPLTRSVWVPSPARNLYESKELSPIIQTITKELSKLLILADASMDRKGDTFVSYSCASTVNQDTAPEDFDLRLEATSQEAAEREDASGGEAVQLGIVNGMEFVLPLRLSGLYAKYDPNLPVLAQHL